MERLDDSNLLHIKKKISIGLLEGSYGTQNGSFA